MQLTYDQEADALAIVITGGIVARTQQIDSGTLVDLDEHGELVAIEVINPYRAWPMDEILRHYPVTPEVEDMLRSVWAEDGPYTFVAEGDLVAA